MEYQFEKLKVWRAAVGLAEKIYLVSRNFPDDERYGMVSQIRRAVVSISLNIAEGQGRYYDKVFVQFLFHSRGSLYEVMTLIKLALSLGYLGEDDADDLRKDCDEIAGMLSGLIKSLKKCIIFMLCVVDGDLRWY